MRNTPNLECTSTMACASLCSHATQGSNFKTSNTPVSFESSLSRPVQTEFTGGGHSCGWGKKAPTTDPRPATGRPAIVLPAAPCAHQPTLQLVQRVQALMWT